MKKTFAVCRNQCIAEVFADPAGPEGVIRIAQKLAQDLEQVFGSGDRSKALKNKDSWEKVGATPILCLTMNEGILGENSEQSVLSESARKQLNAGMKKIAGKRECYFWKIVNAPAEGIRTALVICGSDKRGTIYGMFHLSDLIGVSAWYDWADVTPVHRDEMVLTTADECVSKEPSVRFRGFFINDEWPAFGNWTVKHHNGFTAEMYDRVFELLLRLKGNYLWPAMWSSSFPLDGPGDASAKLADIYGVVMGTSHHEPCLRASEEWDLVRGEGSRYGNEWNYYTNRQGLLNYWEDGLKRSGDLDTVITIGMRGERDSSMLGENSTLKENIDLLKDIITNQRSLIRKYVPDAETHPLMLALYKEVEAYYYGDENTPGLKDWDGLEGVTLLLCEDNYGNMRTLPNEQMRSHNGGFGMYYHFDYHGGPISYEWVNSTPLSKVWEQMTTAYEYGIRDLWIVNVGDLKPQELPLSYFMDLAYDYDKWGINSPNLTPTYLREWVNRQFGGYLSSMEQMQTAVILEGYSRLNGIRRPECLNKDVFHPVHYDEAVTVFDEAKELYSVTESMMEWMPEPIRDAFFELAGFPAQASANVICMQILAGWHDYYQQLGDSAKAKLCAEMCANCIVKDGEFTEQLHTINNGKWYGMGLSNHVGFTHWNDEGWSYPECGLAMLEDKNYTKMTGANEEKVLFAADEVMPPMTLHWGRELLSEEMNRIADTLPAGTYVENEDGISLPASGFTGAGRVQRDKYGWEVLTGYGRSETAVKVLPMRKSFAKGKGPYLEYTIYSVDGGEYTLEIQTAPTNSHFPGGRQSFAVSINGGKVQMLDSLPENFNAGSPHYWPWCIGVLDNVRYITMNAKLNKGINTFRIYAADEGVVPEKFVFYRDYENRKRSYFGPKESYRVL